jgi:KDO2-lipid IV(A) lauroyltransferase
MKKFLWLTEAFMCLVFVVPLGLLPKALSIKTGEFFGLCMFFVLRNRKRIALKNLEIAQNGGLKLPAPPKEIVRRNFINIGRSLSELSMLSVGKKSILKDIEFEGIEHYINAKAKGRGILIITGHCGNWELLSIANSWRSFTFSVIARPLNNPHLNSLVEKVRTKFGNKIIYKSGALREIITIIRNGGTVGILIDQSVVGNEAVVTEFFGEKVYALKIPALLAIKTGAVAVPLFINYLGKGKHCIRFGKEISIRITDNTDDDILFNTRVFSEHIEGYIKENPSEWLWTHRRWKLSHGRKY